MNSKQDLLTQTLLRMFSSVHVKYQLKLLGVLILLCVQAPGSFAEEGLDVSGFIGSDARFYTQTPALSGQESDPDYSMILQPEFRFKINDQRDQFTIIPFGRIDSRDSERTHFDLREAHWLHIADEYELLIGVNKVFWGVAESRHLVDIINQTDAVEDLDGEDKLGQPMVNLVLNRDWGTWEFFLMPHFRERTFVGEKGRLRSLVLIDADHPVYESSAEEYHPDLAVRYSHYIGDWDFGISHFYGTSREPQFIQSREDPSRFSPFYSIIHQTGLDIQLTQDAMLYKFEGIAREGHGDFFLATTIGFEYTFYQVFESSGDIGVLAEYHYDGRDSRAPSSALNNDVFAGVRYALNDVQDTQILAGATYDHETDEIFYNLEAETRITDNIKAEVRVRLFSGAVNSDEALFPIQSDDYIQLRLAYYF